MHRDLNSYTANGAGRDISARRTTTRSVAKWLRVPGTLTGLVRLRSGTDPGYSIIQWLPIVTRAGGDTQRGTRAEWSTAPFRIPGERHG
ncbi:hypothetical protein NDU88_004031 [Pleurodeles waltl]|uniref:Uncharacterized protein n=1 Tax=Pleurodeles waltl TaxID=8319 RepID=A0AAV7UI08_PLEWA|nr:hypothetical protein NDU88_004031 [Pleurodeles waltl]